MTRLADIEPVDIDLAMDRLGVDLNALSQEHGMSPNPAPPTPGAVGGVAPAYAKPPSFLTDTEIRLECARLVMAFGSPDNPEDQIDQLFRAVKADHRPEPKEWR